MTKYKYTIEIINTIFEKEKYKVVSKIYISGKKI